MDGWMEGRTDGWMGVNMQWLNTMLPGKLQPKRSLRVTSMGLCFTNSRGPKLVRTLISSILPSLHLAIHKPFHA